MGYRKQCWLVAAFLAAWTVPVAAGLPIAREKWSVGILGGGQRIYGDEKVESSIGPGLQFLIMQRFRPELKAGVRFGYTELDFDRDTASGLFTEILNLDLLAQFHPVEFGRFRPLLNVGFGIFNFQYLNGNRYFDGEAFMGLGVEASVNQNLALQLNVTRHWTTGDDLDGQRGRGKDGYLCIGAGVLWHAGEILFGKPKSSPALPAETSTAPKEAVTVEPSLSEILSQPQPAPTPRTLADSVRMTVAELERRVREQEQKVETLRRVVEEKAELVERLRQEIASLGPRPAGAQASGFDAGYRQALQLYMDHQYEQAIRAFSALVRDYPDDKNVSNCHYWIGEAYFMLGDYQQAIRSFERVLNYPNSPKLDDALLMLGRANLRLGDANQAAYYLDRLVREFPDSEYVQKAKQYRTSVR